MFLIGICDDEMQHRQHIKELCMQFFAEYPLIYEFIEFTSGEEVLAYQDSILNIGSESNFDVKENRMNKVHLLFLDVEMDGLDGIEVLRRVEDTDWIWRVVFVTSHEEVVLDAFGIKTLGFVKKPVQYHQIQKWLQIAIRENTENVLIEYTSGMQQGSISLDEVYYLEAERNYTYLHTKEKTILLNENLKQWQCKVAQMPIVRIHRSYLINMLHVQKWETYKVKLTNGDELIIGRQFAKTAKEAYLAFVKEKAMKRM